MQVAPQRDVYSAREIALAAGVPEADVVAIVGRGVHVPYGQALRVGRALAQRGHAVFSSRRSPQGPSPLPLAVSSALHLGLIAAALLVTSWASVGTAPISRSVDVGLAPRLVFLAIPGPGGGGGGGGLLQKPPPSKALREGHRAVSSPVPAPKPPEARPAPIDSSPLPVVFAPVIAAPADSSDRLGVPTDTPAEHESRGPGQGGGTGTGAGTGLGEGQGNGVGPGSGGGAGGGPYRGGSGIEPPRVVREVKAEYPYEARRRGIAGDVVLEIVVRRDGSVGEVKVVRGLGAGLSERAIQAVRQWQFVPARRLGVPVDVIVEVAVEFKLR